MFSMFVCFSSLLTISLSFHLLVVFSVPNNPILDTRISCSVLLLSHAQGNPPGFCNGLDWRALVELCPQDFFWCFGIPFKVTKVTTKSYQGYYWAPKIARNGPKQHNKLFFLPEGQNRLGQRPKPSAGARSRPA